MVGIGVLVGCAGRDIARLLGGLRIVPFLVSLRWHRPLTREQANKRRTPHVGRKPHELREKVESKPLIKVLLKLAAGRAEARRIGEAEMGNYPAG